MNPNNRILFNQQFSEEKYQDFLQDIANDFDYQPTFRIGQCT